MKLLLLLSSLIGLSAIFSMNEPKSVHDFTMKTIDGKDLSLATFKGKKLLIVNVASQCGYTPQYKELEALYKKHQDKLVILGFPANNFGGQEPGSNAEIQGFCQKNFGVTFPMFEKISVVGKDRHPLFAFLSDKAKNGAVGDEPKWNFCKYLVDENGKVLQFFPSRVSPTGKEIETALAK